MAQKKSGVAGDAYRRVLRKVKKFIGLENTDPNKDPMGLGNTSGGRSNAAREAEESLAENDKSPDEQPKKK